MTRGRWLGRSVTAWCWWESGWSGMAGAGLEFGSVVIAGGTDERCLRDVRTYVRCLHLRGAGARSVAWHMHWVRRCV